MTKIYNFLCLLILFSFLSLGSMAQSNIASQSFEGAGTWSYSEFPNPYTVYTSASDRWGICGNNTSTGDTVGTQPIIVFNNGDVIAPFFSNIKLPKREKK